MVREFNFFVSGGLYYFYKSIFWYQKSKIYFPWQPRYSSWKMDAILNIFFLKQAPGNICDKLGSSICMWKIMHKYWIICWSTSWRFLQQSRQRHRSVNPDRYECDAQLAWRHFCINFEQKFQLWNIEMYHHSWKRASTARNKNFLICSVSLVFSFWGSELRLTSDPIFLCVFLKGRGAKCAQSNEISSCRHQRAILRPSCGLSLAELYLFRHY